MDTPPAAQFAPAVARNRDPILAVMRRVLPATGTVLEIASGTGEHAAYFAAGLSRLIWQPTDIDPDALASIAAHRAAANAPNLNAPLALDVTSPSWPIAQADAIVSINMIHIAPWTAAQGLMAGAERLLRLDQILYLYGPFKENGRHTAPSNADFDAGLRARDPDWGVRDAGDVRGLAGQHGFEFVERVAMPANNRASCSGAARHDGRTRDATSMNTTDSPFSRTAWNRNAKAYETIRTMPFNAELAAGVLSEAHFKHYITQDAHYLVGFGRALALAAAKAPSPERLIQFATSAEGAIVVERALHGSFFEKYGINSAAFEAMPLSPACHHYVSYLLSVAYAEPYEVLLGALLPCFWIYAEVGRDIHARAASANPYQAWIDTYAGEQFHAAVRATIEAADEVAADASPALRERMHGAFTRATQLEWIFWDSAHRLETWPV